MPSNGIKAIFFDLDGTLRHSVPSGGEVSTEYIRSLGVDFSEADRVNALRWELVYWANSQDLLNDMKMYASDDAKFWVQYSQRRLRALGVSKKIAEELAPKVSAYMGEFYTPKSIVPEDAQRVLPQLKEQGYILAVISNRDKSFQEELDSHGLSEYFHFSLAGGEVDSYKPEPGIFQHALKRVDVRAEETIYVGDNYYADVIGSRRAGLRPVLYDPGDLFPDADCETIRSFDELITIVRA
jgi:HAD superfamily hydrolase (TIGR01549 family)